VKVLSGIDLGPFLDVGRALSPAAAKRALGIPESAPVVGKVARLFPLKGHDHFLAAAARIAQARPDCWFLLVGDGILRDELEARARAAGIAERTVFAGLVAPGDVPRHLQAMDVVLHASLREGIARVLPQAGAVGKPVVTFELDGAPEVIEDGVSGYLVPPGDEAGLAARTLHLLEDPELRERMGVAGRRFAAEHFSAERMVARVDAIYARFNARLAAEAKRAGRLDPTPASTRT
jgi:glycosyltransferase involved in cell wall biosynthesis